MVEDDDEEERGGNDGNLGWIRMPKNEEEGWIQISFENLILSKLPVDCFKLEKIVFILTTVKNNCSYFLQRVVFN